MRQSRVQEVYDHTLLTLFGVSIQTTREAVLKC